MVVSRRVALAVAVVLVIAACSGDGGTQVFEGSSTTTPESGGMTSVGGDGSATDAAGRTLGDEAVATVEAIVDEHGAPGATDPILLALERGYTYEQLLAVGTDGTGLSSRGVVVRGDDVVDPDSAALGLIDLPDSPTVSGIRQPTVSRTVRFDLGDLRGIATALSERAPVHPVDVEETLSTLAVTWIVWMMRNGYTSDQIVEAIVLGGHLTFERFGESNSDRTDCGVLYIGDEPIAPLAEPPAQPACFDLVKQFSVPPWPMGMYAPATRVGSTLDISLQFAPGGRYQQRAEWFADASIDWYVDDVLVGELPTTELKYEHDFEAGTTHVVSVWWSDGNRSGEYTQEVEVLPAFEVGLDSFSVLDDAGTSYPVEHVIYEGEKITVTGVVRGLSGEPRGRMTFEDDAEDEWRYGFGRLTEVEPRETGVDAVRAWQVAQTMWPGMSVEFLVFDDDVGASGVFGLAIDITPPPENPTAWGGGDSCQGEGEGTLYSTQWQVRMTDNGDGTWTADIYYHDCPDRGRAHYRGPAIPITDYRWWAEVEFVDGKGPLGANAPAQMPGPLQHYLVTGFNFEDNVQETIGVR